MRGSAMPPRGERVTIADPPPARTPPLDASHAITGAMMLGLVAAGVVGTQLVAHTLHFHRHLGAPLWRPEPRTLVILRAATIAACGTGSAVAVALRRWRWLLPITVAGALGAALALGPLYSPERIVVWQSRFGSAAPFARTFAVAWLAAAGVLVGALLSAHVLAQPRARLPRSDSHGSARWGNGAALRRPTGLILGRLHGQLLRYDGDGHVLTVAPTRSGKGIGGIIPNLLCDPTSMLVTDPKGENFAVTARARRAMGHTVIAIDPFNEVGGTGAFNPFDLLDEASPDLNDDAWMLAEMLAMQADARSAEQTFWHEEARALLAGLILHVATAAPAELRTLTYVRDLLTLPPDRFADLLGVMSESGAADGLVARAAARLLQKADKERSGVISTAQSHTHFLDSARMSAVLAESTLSFAHLKTAPTTIYLVLPPNRLDTYARWMRLMVACALLGVTRVANPRARVVRFVLDEFAHLGKLTPIQQAVGLVGAYEVRLWLIVQDLAQLKGTYPEQWNTFVANAHVLQAWGANDWDTADWLSRLTGDATIGVESENRSAGVSHGRQWQRQQSAALSVAEKARRLLLPDEVRRLPRDRELVFVAGERPVLAERISYLTDPEFAGLADPNPLYADVA
jgi:type IV secretion system protein VirD4